MDLVVLVLFYGLYCLMLPSNIVGLWWVVGGPLLLDPDVICRKKGRLAGKQRTICREQPELVREVAHGARLAIQECQEQFAHRRWNCTQTRRSIGKILKRDSREAAFVWAISAAGVMYSVTKACSRGSLTNCQCVNARRSYDHPGNFIWSGCHDNVTHGYQVSRDFMDYARPRRRHSDIRTLIHLHNNEAGRLAAQTAIGLSCKCHGLSGSCSMKTCFKQLQSFHYVGLRLKELFDGATKVMGSNDGANLLPDGETLKPPNVTNLIYADDSPNFCRRNIRQGSLGTSGRPCDPTSASVGGCEILCCGRGHRKYTVERMENCKCRFVYCCEVICEKCMILRTEHRCV